MGFKYLKIIPVFVCIALLSFSVRLVEVFKAGDEMSASAFRVSVLSPAAGDAKDDGAGHDDPVSGEALDDKEEKTGQDAPLVDGLYDEDSVWDDDVDSDLGLDGAFPNWRDPSEEDPGYETSRMAVFRDLTMRRKEIEKKERAFETRMALLKAAEQELDQKYKELKRLRQELEGLLERQSDEEQARTKSLVKIYEGMKPKDAARIFNTLDLDILVEVVAQMSERKLSPVLAAMNAERARTITIMLAEQKQLPSLP